MKTYIGIAVVNAEPVLKNGVEYYRINHDDGHSTLMPRVVFDRKFREATVDEIALFKEVLVT
jgi:hypothetical protein